MTPDNFIIILCIAAILASAIVIVPLARFIPWHMVSEWRDIVVESGQGVPPPLAPADYKLSLQFKIVVCCAGGAMGILAARAYGSQFDAAMMCFYLLSLVLLVAINLKHLLLPDVVVLTLLWVGLLYSGGSGDTAEYVGGALGGYCATFLLTLTIKLATRREFLIAPADPKALAMAGAWLGMVALPYIFGVFIFVAILHTLMSSKLGRSSTPTGPAHLVASLSYVIATRIL